MDIGGGGEWPTNLYNYFKCWCLLTLENLPNEIISLTPNSYFLSPPPHSSFFFYSVDQLTSHSIYSAPLLLPSTISNHQNRLPVLITITQLITPPTHVDVVLDNKIRDLYFVLFQPHPKSIAEM